ncbi:hypothetical protein HanPSC8_Chr14g0613911 [Helianthus annuus]|nr:hypothetical protein HanPSC8_Chr14g0613911 [Helianthus annuus]
MGRGLGRGLGENAQATTPGEFGLGRGPWGLGLKPGVGRASKVTWQALYGQTKLDISHAPMCQLMHPTQAPPYPIGVGLSLFSTCQLMPQPKPQLKSTIPHGLIMNSLSPSSYLNYKENVLIIKIFFFFLINRYNNQLALHLQLKLTVL